MTSSRKDELRDAALDYLAARGLSDLSLRPLAAILGTSARILIFHFGSKEGLVQDVMRTLHRRLQQALQCLAENRGETAPLRLFWDWATDPENTPYLRLSYELQILAVQNPAVYGAILRDCAMEWHGMADALVPDDLRDGPMATMLIAIFDGLFLDFIASGERERLTAALDLFLDLVRARDKAR